MSPRSLLINAELTNVDPAHRTITGRIVPWNSLGYTSAGPTRFRSFSLEVPDDPARVKLLIQHDGSPMAVGVGVAFSYDSAGVIGLFHLPPGDEGDRALAAAADRRRDGLSVGVVVHEADFNPAGELEVIEAQLLEVSLVTIPAFSEALVSRVAASHQTKGDPMSPRATSTEPPAEPTAPPAPPAEPATEPPDTDPIDTPLEGLRVEAQAPAVIPARPGNPRSGGRGLSLRAAATIAFEHIRAGRPPHMLSAALQDLIPADDVGEGLLRPQFIDEVWNASRSARPVIDSIRRARLESLTIVGWRYQPEMTVAPYAGAKAAIPSTKVATVVVTGTATRFAGGLDIDRVYIDLGSPGLVEDLFGQATDSYRTQTEDWVVTALLAAAADLTADSLTAFLIEAGTELQTIGASLDWVTVASDVWATFAGLGSAEVPWWLDNGDGSVNVGSPGGTAGKVAFSVNPDLAAGVMLAGDSRAATFYEVNPPIRVRAENIPNGGVDIGVFGYCGLIINDPRAIVNATIPPVVPGTVSSSSAKK